MDELLKKIAKAEVSYDSPEWNNITLEAKIFLKACFTKAPFLRITPKEAKYHPWIKSIKLEVYNQIHNSKRPKIPQSLLDDEISPKNKEEKFIVHSLYVAKTMSVTNPYGKFE